MSDHNFMTRLARDSRGNTIAMMAAAMVPLMGFTGSAIDMARLYVVKTRLQQACDAGVLAGRKAMTDTSPTGNLDPVAKAQADEFFKNNFPVGWYKTKDVDFKPKKSIDGAGSTAANAVSADAKVTVPMAVMGFFGMGDRELAVTCQARLDLADTDVMFVLDTTGSMSCVPGAAATCANSVIAFTRSDGTTGYHNEESASSKIDGLRDAVILFDQTMRDNADKTTHFRYGFVTYSSSVNVGGVIPPQYLQSTTHTYQSRRLSPTNNGDYDFEATSNFTLTNVPQAACLAERYPASGFVKSTPRWADQGYYQARKYSEVVWTTPNGGTCKGKQQKVRALWRYEPISYNIGAYAAGQTVTVPGRLDGVTSKWRGCVEEVDTTNASSFNVDALPDDLNPDFKPSADDNKWRPIWPEVEWLRSSYTMTEVKDELINEASVNQYEDYTYRAGSTLDRSGSVACGMPAFRLKEWTKQQVNDYVNNVDFKPYGGTYHDVGMIWGTRMLSPDGAFADDTKAWPGRNEPSRNIVFMTDGHMAPSLTSYGLYGVETWDQRVAPAGANVATATDRHNARFRVECDAAKKKGITVYVVAFGIGLNSDLTYCASPGQAFQASNKTKLEEAFQTIAKRIAMLRITQ